MIESKENKLDLCSGMVGADGFSPKVFGDKLAEVVDWNPMHKKGTLKTLRKVKKCGYGKFKYNIKSSTLATISLLIVCGMSLMVLGVFSFLTQIGDISYNHIYISLAGMVVVVLNIAYFLKIRRQYMFDKNLGIFKKAKETIQIKDMHALQIIKKQFSAKNAFHTCYELNIIMKDTSRVFIIDYDQIKDAQDDAAKLSNFLNLKIWEKIS